MDEVTAARRHEAGRTRLHAVQLAVEEIHSRREDGITEFGKDEAAVGRLVRALDAILNADAYDAGGALSFLETALQSYKPAANVAEAFERARSRNLANPDETYRLWLLFALSQPGVLLQTLSDVLPMHDLLTAFYLSQSPLHDDQCVSQLTALVASATTHPLHGPIAYRVDVTGLSLFESHDEPSVLVTRRRAATLKPKSAAGTGASGTTTLPRRKTVKGSGPHHLSAGGHTPLAPSSPAPQGHADPATASLESTVTDAVSPVASDASAAMPLATTSPSMPHDVNASTRPRRATVARPQAAPVATSVEATQTDEELLEALIPRPPPKAHRDTMTDDPAPGHTYQELTALDRVLGERDRVNKETSERLRRESDALAEQREDLEDSLDNVANVLRSLKALYNHHFLLVKDAQDAGAPIDRTRVDELFPRIVDVLNGGGGHASNASSSALPSPAGPAPPMAAAPIPVAGNSGALHGSSAQMARSAASEADVGMPVGSPTMTDGGGSFVAVSEGGTARIRLDSTVADGRTRSLSVLPPPGSSPPMPQLKRPWRVTMLREVERSQQLELQHYRCPACHRDLPNPTNSNLLAKAVQRANKPRRCHYTGELYCHDCHSNQKRVIPFLAVQQWDFTEMHVSNRDADFLAALFTKPMVSLDDLPRDIRNRPVVAHAAKLRGKLSRMYAILYACPDARTSFGHQLGHYYFLHERHYSLKDLASLRNREDAEGGAAGAGKRSVGGSINRMLLGSQGMDLIAGLEGLVKTSREHIIDKCHHCRSRAVKRCTLCGDADPVIMFENGATCPDCGGAFHDNCLALGCSDCDAKRHAAGF